MIPEFEKDNNTAYDRIGSDQYFGWADRGTTTAEAKWKIIKLEAVGNGWLKKYPDGKSTFQFVWDDRASLTYKLLIPLNSYGG